MIETGDSRRRIWQRWALANTGGDQELAHAATSAALGALATGADAEAAAAAGQAAAEALMEARTRSAQGPRRRVRLALWLLGAALAGATGVIGGPLAAVLAVGTFAVAVRVWRSDLEAWVRATLVLATVSVATGLWAVSSTLLLFLAGR